jgi:hypothetical protein
MTECEIDCNLDEKEIKKNEKKKLNGTSTVASGRMKKTINAYM